MMESSNQFFNPILILKFPIVGRKIPFWEDYYLKTMTQMRLMRLEIPLEFTPKFLYEFLTHFESEFDENGFVSLCIGIENPIQNFSKSIYKKYFSSSDFFRQENFSLDLWSYGVWELSQHNSLELNHPLFYTLDKTREEIEVDDLLLLNKEKSIARTLFGNLFLKVENKDEFITNRIEDGGLDDVAREKFVGFLQSKNYTIVETSIKSYQIQQAENVFVTDNRFLARTYSRYKKKNFDLGFANRLLEEYKNSFNFERWDL